MKYTLTTNEVALALINDEHAEWSHNGAIALAEHLELIEEDCKIELEMDVILIRCEWSEYHGFIDWADQHFANYYEQFGLEYTNPITGEIEEQSVVDCDGNFHDVIIDDIIEYIEERGQIIRFDGGIIVSNF
tara:strand:- start:2961 stop:3356 length:396 start_codon:yes stop_codon:yes gene_type:complete